jgi:hypothetical protein
VELIREIAPSLLEIPFQSFRVRRKQSKAKKALTRAGRILFGHRPPPDIGVAEAARAIVGNPEIRDDIELLANELSGDLRERGYRSILERPDEAPYAVGSLVTAAMALRARDNGALLTRHGQA